VGENAWLSATGDIPPALVVSSIDQIKAVLSITKACHSHQVAAQLSRNRAVCIAVVGISLLFSLCGKLTMIWEVITE